MNFAGKYFMAVEQKIRWNDFNYMLLINRFLNNHFLASDYVKFT